MDRNRTALLAVVGMMLVAGCVDVTMTTEVGSDGDIESLEVEIEVSENIFTMYEDEAEREGYDSVEEYLEADMNDEPEDGQVEFDEISVDETEDGTYVITMSASDVDPDDLDDIEIEVDGDTVRYEATESPEENLEDGLEDEDENADTGTDDEMDDLGDDVFNIEYVVVMPGEITDHNADEISDDGMTATWHLDGEEVETIYVESEIDDDGLPGFGVGVAVAAILLSIAGLAKRNR